MNISEGNDGWVDQVMVGKISELLCDYMAILGFLQLPDGGLAGPKSGQLASYVIGLAYNLYLYCLCLYGEGSGP